MQSTSEAVAHEEHSGRKCQQKQREGWAAAVVCTALDAHRGFARVALLAPLGLLLHACRTCVFLQVEGGVFRGECPLRLTAESGKKVGVSL